jgi:hypothetical protein
MASTKETNNCIPAKKLPHPSSSSFLVASPYNKIIYKLHMLLDSTQESKEKLNLQRNAKEVYFYNSRKIYSIIFFS